MKIGILTFHAAHNYGSMLQNYALQQVLIKLGHQPETINLRTPMQKEMYDYFKPVWQLMDKKRVLYTLLYLPWVKQLKKKHDLFEHFLYNRLVLSKEINNFDDLGGLPKYDAYIIGSDQCWNMTAKDFDWSYFLGFTPEDSVKLSYAISMGPKPTIVSETCREQLPRVKALLQRFNGISVRDKDTKEVIDLITEDSSRSSIHIDPTLLLTKEEWNATIPKDTIVKEKYIFFYNPYWVESAFAQARELGRITGLPVVTSNPNLRGNIQYRNFEKVFEVGPSEFLNLVKNAEYVVGRSFHLIVFCILLNKRFIAVEGMGDSRINQLLQMTSLENCATENGNVSEVIERLSSIDFKIAENQLLKYRKESIHWLEEHLTK